MPANPYQFLDAAVIQSKLDAYNAAETAILAGAQSYSMNGVSVSRASLPQVQEAIGMLSRALRLKTGQAVKVATPIVRKD